MKEEKLMCGKTKWPYNRSNRNFTLTKKTIGLCSTFLKMLEIISKQIIGMINLCFKIIYIHFQCHLVFVWLTCPSRPIKSYNFNDIVLEVQILFHFWQKKKRSSKCNTYLALSNFSYDQ